MRRGPAPGNPGSQYPALNRLRDWLSSATLPGTAASLPLCQRPLNSRAA